MIEVNEISKYYGSFCALNKVSFEVKKGEVLGFLGPNGAGKSTTMKILTTFISASEGTASVNGYDVNSDPMEVRKQIGYLPETPPLYDEMTVEEYLTFAGRARGLSGEELRSSVSRVVSDTDLTSKFKSRIAELSKGFRQRTGIAQALIHDPAVLILDEPTSGLDPRQIIEIRQLIEKLRGDKIIIFSTHILQEATAVAGRLVVIDKGEVIADGTGEELATKAQDTHTIRVLVRGTPQSFAADVEAFDNVSAVDTDGAPEGYSRYIIHATGGARGVRELGEKLSTFLNEKQIPVAEIAPSRLTLEEIFLKLLGHSATAKNESKPSATDTKKSEAPVKEEATADDDAEPEEKPATVGQDTGGDEEE